MKDQEFQAYAKSVRFGTVLYVWCTHIQQHDGKKQDSQSAIDRETEAKTKTITASYKENKDEVVKKLLDRVVLVKPELHRNLKKLGD